MQYIALFHGSLVCPLEKKTKCTVTLWSKQDKSNQHRYRDDLGKILHDVVAVFFKHVMPSSKKSSHFPKPLLCM